MTVSAAASAAGPELLRRSATGVPGLYRHRRGGGLAVITSAIIGAYRGEGPVRLGRDRGLAVIAVDGFGFAAAARTLRPDVLTPLVSEFPTTTVACLLTSVTGQSPDTHGFIGVQYLHDDGLHAVNCHDGRLYAPAQDAPAGDAPARPTVTPASPTIFGTLADLGIASAVAPNELSLLDTRIRDHLLRGAGTTLPSLAPAPDPPSLVTAFGEQVTAALSRSPSALVWGYLDLDSHIHRRGVDGAVDAAGAALDRLARRLCRAGVAVLVFSDHGLTANHPSAGTLAAWEEGSDERWCRLPAGGAGRVRWLYPHAAHRDRLAARLADRIPDAVVASPGQLARWGLVRDGSIGQRRIGEIVLLARGPDFPVPGTGAAFEHGSMTAEEVLVPMAIWRPDR
jgi:hypothetical protein